MGTTIRCGLLVSLSVLAAYGQSLSCRLEDATIASNEGGRLAIERTGVNWKRIEYHIVGKKAVALVYKDAENVGTKVNPQQRDELLVAENTPTRVVLMSQASGNAALNLIVDVIFPKAGNGFGYFVSDYGGGLGSFNAAKLYLLRCRNSSTTIP
jgi:hypothetical protein